MGANDAFLQSYRVLRTQDLDEARHAVAARYCDHRLDLQRGRQLDVRYNHARGEHISLNLLGYGGDVEIDPGALQSFYLVQLPLAGFARVVHRSEEIDASPLCGTILNPDRPTQMAWGADCTKLMLQIDSAFLRSVARDSLGVPLPGPVRFAPRIDMARPGGRLLKRHAMAVAAAIEAGTLSLCRKNLQLLATERELVQTLLEHQPSNISHFLAAFPRSVARHQVRRAQAFIHAHFAEDIRLEDIARAAGLHPRSLQIGFRDAIGVSPTTYLRNLRLDTALFHLSRRANRPRVTEVAHDCGFGHLGRFARDFRARFGQSPRDWRDS
ncbi:AraC family transcriptional regulator [Roseobacter sinensis]|uniref:AraC family transcriptional regulator n=1 Tax=Roseobacter sinensis TaxID=2931391 RepID=A0ABT3BJD2_9RHOB|nr:AraC family transcriptional regulator [Roseobacter sp. WL0113]MCV3273676.1 AraC family transcriptional regulator [Roseobacter sp. WL0113]